MCCPHFNTVYEIRETFNQISVFRRKFWMLQQACSCVHFSTFDTFCMLFHVFGVLFCMFHFVCTCVRTHNPGCTVLYRFVPFCTVLYRLYGAPKVVFQDPGRHRLCSPVFFTCLRAWFQLIFVVFTLVHIADAWSFEHYFFYFCESGWNPGKTHKKGFILGPCFFVGYLCGLPQLRENNYYYPQKAYKH